MDRQKNKLSWLKLYKISIECSKNEVMTLLNFYGLILRSNVKEETKNEVKSMCRKIFMATFTKDERLIVASVIEPEHPIFSLGCFSRDDLTIIQNLRDSHKGKQD